MLRKVLTGIIGLQFIGVSCCFALNNNEWDYRSKVHQQEAKENYEKSLMPKSGYMTVQEYEKESMAKDKSQGTGEYIKKVEDSKMVYIPQPHYKLVRYNNPPGSPEMHLHRSLFHEKQELPTALIAPDVSMMIQPIVSYYSKTKSTDCDVYVVPLRQGQTDVDKVKSANIAAKDPKPIFSTDRTVIEYGTFRTITPVDFSADMRYVVAKEKTGNVEDGIWQTEMLVYDFLTKKTIRVPEIREAIRYYWRTTKNMDIKELRWDIYPLGFSVKNPDRILVAAYAFAGNPPRCLGIWSIDVKSEQTRLESVMDNGIEVSTIGLKIIEDGIIDPESVEAEAKMAEAYEKDKAKNEKKAEKERRKQLKKQYKEEVKEIKKEYNELKKEDTSKDSRSDKVHSYIPLYKIKGGKPTGFEDAIRRP